MGIGSISFWQQDQNYWQQAQAQSSASSADDALINVMGQAETNLAKGLASIANQTALNRVNNEITALVQQALQASGSSTSSSSSGSTGSSSSSSGSSSSSATASSNSSNSPAPATGTGTVPLTTSTPLLSLGILAGAKISISAGANSTTYVSTGTDTVADLIDAINVDLPTNAQVTATLNSKGQLVITSRNDKDTIVVGGYYAANIGFGVGNDTFSPTKAASSSSASSSSSATSNSTSSSNTSANSASNTTSTTTVSSPISENISTAASLLSADGVAGTLVNLLV
jgi:peptidoglycan DL-endopeptidase CwlO